MKRYDTGKVQDKLLNRLERKEKQESFQRDRFFKFKLPEIQSRLIQALLMEKIIETEDTQAVNDLLSKGLKKILTTNEFDFKYFIAPIRNLLPRPNPLSLYLTQYILEVMIDEPCVIDVYGTDLEIYKVVNDVISRINVKFERAEAEILQQVTRNKSLIPGSREYDIALEQAFRRKMGDPQQ